MLDASTSQIQRYMDLLSVRQNLVASNLANIDTPGYRTKDINFQAEFQNYVDGMPPEVVEVSGLTTRNDGNNVSLERETRLLAENALKFRVAASLELSHLKMKRMAIHDGSQQ
jgi:flagellar basal-body rod protein FlgB